MARFRSWQIKLQGIEPDARSRDIYSYPLFSFYVGARRQHISGRIRALLNEQQKPRWDYFFRPNLKLLTEIDREQLSALSWELGRIKAEIAVLKKMQATLSQLAKAVAADSQMTTILSVIAVGAAILTVATYFVANAFLAFLVALVGAAAFAGVWILRPRQRIESLEKMRDQLAPDLSEQVKTAAAAAGRRESLLAQATLAANRIQAIERFRQEIAAQKPSSALNESDVDQILAQALDHLRDKEWKTLNIFGHDGAVVFGPIIRWAFETDRKELLESLRPPVYSIARRGGHYVRYDVQIVFVHEGQLTLVQAFYDLIQGEFRKTSKKHIILANLSSVQEDVIEDFDFRHRLRDAVTLSYTGSDLGSDDATAVAEIDEDFQEGDDDADFVSVIQTRTIKFVGPGEPTELKFVISGQREGLITQLRHKREIEEAAIAEIAQQKSGGFSQRDGELDELSAHEARVQRLREDEERVRRSTTTYDVEHIVSEILVHTSRAVGGRRTETGS